MSLNIFFFFFSSRRRHTRSLRGWSSDVCSSDLDRAGEQGERGERRRGGEHQPLPVERAAQRPDGWHAGEQVAQPERAQDEQPRPGRLGPEDAGGGHGHELSRDGAITSSRSSHPGGWRSANRTACATSSGWLSLASGGGLYCSSRSSKNAVCMPPGTSMVTPTSPAASAASARLKPTTPNLEAQYAVASLTARSPSVEAQVTTRPWERRR